MNKSSPDVKPFKIPKQLVWEAYKRVKANKGAAGVDRQSIEDFEKDLKNNLYKVWLRHEALRVRMGVRDPRRPAVVAVG